MQNFAPGIQILWDVYVLDPWKLITLKSENLELDFLPAIGGRLWDIKFQGDSLLFQNPDLKGRSFHLEELEALPTRSPQFEFPLWGGEKTWVAPDSLWSNGKPFPTLDSGTYTVISKDKAEIKMVSAVCPLSNLSISRRIILTSATTWTIEHQLKNHGTKTQKVGIWSVMMLNHPAKIAVGMDDPSSFSVFGSDEGSVALRRNCVVVECSKQKEFKIGLSNPDGHTLIKCGDEGPWLQCSVPIPQRDDQYAHDNPFEIFNSGDYAYCESEWHSPTQNLKTGENLSFTQTFSVCAERDTIPTFSNCTEIISCMC